MATFDKQSVRDEFEKIKMSFDEQVKAGKVSTEVAMLFNTMMMLFSLVLSIFMEKTTKKTSKNSSIPPSQTTPDNTSTTNKGGPDKDKQKTVTMAGNTRTVETVTVIPALVCNICGEDLSNVACICVERRTMIDIIFEKTEEHIDVEIKQCPTCNNKVKASFPKDMPGPVQYGNGVKAQWH